MNPNRPVVAKSVRIAVCFLCAVPYPFLPFSYSARLESPTWWGLCAVGSLMWLATAASLRARGAFAFAAVSCFAMAGLRESYFFPLHQRVDGVAFTDAPLPEVLRTISQQRQSQPYRRFVICDEENLKAKLSVTIPQRSTLGESLDMIANAAGCKYEWHWWSWCGNSYPPTTIKIYFYAPDKTMKRKGVWEIDRDRLLRRDENGEEMLVDDKAFRELSQKIE